MWRGDQRRRDPAGEPSANGATVVGVIVPLAGPQTVTVRAARLALVELDDLAAPAEVELYRTRPERGRRAPR